MRWRIAGQWPLLHRCWDGQCAVYHTGSGDTFVLDAANAGVLLSIARSPATIAELLKLDQVQHLDETNMAELLRLFHQHSLIEPVP